MDITPFYELKNRLYYTASAGCSTINEDFRLKRAVENFKPLSAVNKPFTKLYMMCENLFKTDSKNVASELSECIALADALAVVQGTYNDASETEKSKNNIRLKPFNLPYSEYHSMIESIQKPNSYMIFNNLNANQIKFVLDPRMIMGFIEKIKKNTNSEYFETFITFILKMYGNELIPLFKNNINLDDPKNNGNTVKYVSSVAGADENEWYMELAKNENNPVGVRVSAIKALAFSCDNVDLLMELYHTEKGKIKNTIIESLAILSPPEADEIWKKMTVSLEKFKSINFKYISLSKSDVCKKFAIEYIYDHMEQISKMKKSEYDKSKLNLIEDIEILNNKTGDDIEECIMKIMEFSDSNKIFIRKSYAYNCFSNMLINNIETHPNDKSYKNMINNLYEKNPDAFCRAEFYTNLRDNPKKAFEDAEKLPLQQRSETIDILRNIWYSCLL
ncbi:MAG: hypothetical protein K2G63_01020 [Oscillospiraceae bacterium]|nr:hypothetical protein [Oscillospiraceae bacterium]